MRNTIFGKAPGSAADRTGRFLEPHLRERGRHRGRGLRGLRPVRESGERSDPRRGFRENPGRAPQTRCGRPGMPTAIVSSDDPPCCCRQRPPQALFSGKRATHGGAGHRKDRARRRGSVSMIRGKNGCAAVERGWLLGRRTGVFSGGRQAGRLLEQQMGRGGSREAGGRGGVSGDGWERWFSGDGWMGGSRAQPAKGGKLCKELRAFAADGCGPPAIAGDAGPLPASDSELPLPERRPGRSDPSQPHSQTAPKEFLPHRRHTPPPPAIRPGLR